MDVCCRPAHGGEAECCATKAAWRTSRRGSFFHVVRVVNWSGPWRGRYFRVDARGLACDLLYVMCSSAPFPEVLLVLELRRPMLAASVIATGQDGS